MLPSFNNPERKDRPGTWNDLPLEANNWNLLMPSSTFLKVKMSQFLNTIIPETEGSDPAHTPEN